MFIPSTIVQIARELRRNQTPEEEILWQALRNRKLNGFKFLRQHPIVYDKNNPLPGFIVADFYCAEKQLILELDGKIHDYQKEHDQKRDFIMETKGYWVIRIKNEEVDNLDQLLEKIRKVLE